MECAAICDVLELVDHHYYSTKTNEAKALLKSIVLIFTTVLSDRFVRENRPGL
jgi:hypothetical protein